MTFVGLCLCTVDLTVLRSRHSLVWYAWCPCLLGGRRQWSCKVSELLLIFGVGATASSAGLSSSGRRASLDGECDRRLRLPFTTRNAMLMRAIPTFCARPYIIPPCTACRW